MSLKIIFIILKMDAKIKVLEFLISNKNLQ